MASVNASGIDASSNVSIAH